MNNQWIYYGTDDEYSSNNIFMFRQQSSFLWEKNWVHMPSSSGSYGRLAAKIQVDFEIFRILYRLNFF